MIWLMKVGKIVFYAWIQLSATSLSKNHLNDCDFEAIITTFESLVRLAMNLKTYPRIKFYLHSERI